MTTINTWRVYCEDEAAFITGYLPEGETCTVCFNNNTHTVNTSSITIVSSLSEKTTLISTNDNSNIGGNYKNECTSIDILAGIDVVTTNIKIYPYEIGVLSFSLDLTQENVGDIFDIIVTPINYSPIGVLPVTVAIGATNIDVGGASAYLNVGYFLHLLNGVNDEYIEIKSISGSIVTLVSGTTFAYDIGSYISFRVYRVSNYKIKTPGYRYFGNFLRTSTFTTMSQAVVVYTNKSGEAKEFTYGIEFLY